MGPEWFLHPFQSMGTERRLNGGGGGGGRKDIRSCLISDLFGFGFTDHKFLHLINSGGGRIHSCPGLINVPPAPENGQKLVLGWNFQEGFVQEARDGLGGTEDEFALLIQQPRVQFSELSKTFDEIFLMNYPLIRMCQWPLKCCCCHNYHITLKPAFNLTVYYNAKYTIRSDTIGCLDEGYQDL